MAVAQNLSADRRVRLHLQELAVGQLGRLEQDSVGETDLAEIVEGRGAADQVGFVLGQSDGEGKDPGTPGNPPRVLTGVIVKILRRPGQTIEDLLPGFDELLGALPDTIFEFPILRFQPPVEHPGLEQVVDPQLDLGDIERLGEEILRPERERSRSRAVLTRRSRVNSLTSRSWVAPALASGSVISRCAL